MNANPEALPDTDGVPAESGEPPVKPVRRRRTVKASDEAAATSESPEPATA